MRARLEYLWSTRLDNVEDPPPPHIEEWVDCPDGVSRKAVFKLANIDQEDDQLPWANYTLVKFG